MKKKLLSLITYALAASMIFLPFSAQAGIISTDQAIASVQDLASREKAQDFLNRTDVTATLESMGVTDGSAQDRVKAMTQEEINRIANKIDSMPAGGWFISTGALGIIAATVIVIVALTTRN